ncbi:MAG: hypothetical protein KC776_11605 [Myxococcales bacterium]|nr:hypothetical protein [Myxococcales bacterium]MCB9579673.1 hypothetical protein [Polyangiaceae bacterium]
MRTTMISLLVVTVALLACKKEEDKTEAPRAEATPAATPVAPAPEPTPAEPARTAEPSDQPQSRTGIPTEGNSKPPTVAEWNAVGEITVRHSTPLGCETKLVREWLRVSCRTASSDANQILAVELTRGKDSGGIPPFVKKGVASIVTRVKPGMDAEWTYRWSQWGTRKLMVRWPNGAPSPTYEFDQSAPK